MSKDKKLNNLLGMKDFSEKELEQKKAPTKRTGVAKDILQENTGKDDFKEEKMKKKEEIEKKGLNNLISLDNFSEKETLKDAKKTKHTDVAKDVLQERYARPEGGKYIAINEFDYASPEVKNWIYKNCSCVNCSQLDPTDITGLPYKGGYARPEWMITDKIICFKDYDECSPIVKREIEKLNPAIFNGSQIDITDLQGLPLSESLTGKEPTEKAKTKEEIEKKGLNNLISLDNFSEKETLKDAKKTKHTDVAKDVLQEKWEKKVKIEKTGEHAGKTVAEIKKQMAELKGKKPFNKEKYSELLFALRSKQGWKKGEGATKK